MLTNSTQKKNGKTRAARLALVLAAAAIAIVVVGCEGGQAGDKCSSNSDCNESLTSQPIEGRNQDYCCAAYGPEVPVADITPDNCRAITTVAPTT